MEHKDQVEGIRGIAAAAALVLSLALTACATTPETSLNWPGATYLTVVVRSGDTVSQIADRYSVSTNTLVAMNDIENRDSIYPGQVLHVPAIAHATRSAVMREATSNPVYSAPLPQFPRRVTVASYVLQPVTVAKSQPAYQPVEVKPTPRIALEVQNAAKAVSEFVQPVATGSEFEWPVAGHVIAAFGSYGNGERNDGINIAANLGEPIHAAAAGTVTYAGNELKGYGNLVLIRHDDGYVTAYAHAQNISVNRGDRVEKGQIIGTAGETGDVTSPQLHFEIRRGVQPVDPKPLLMASSS
jgi:murein DD-endopeptidase MepM/ murein hydrolase activator NlpD